MVLPVTLTRDHGRTLAYDDVGDPSGDPVVYLHGTPDSRLARPTDDGLAETGIRLLAVDRPGYGGTSPLFGEAAQGGPGFPADLAALLDALHLDRVTLLAWSGGALDALVAAGSDALAGRLERLVVAGGLVPCEAFDDPEVAEAGHARLGLMDLAASLSADELAEAVAPLLAPWPCDHDLALEHQREQRSPADQAVLAQIPGAIDRLAASLVEAVRHGLAGVRADVVAQVTPLGSVLDRVTLPVQLWYGAADTVTPPAFGRWCVGHLTRAKLTVVEGAGHYLPFTNSSTLLSG